MKQEEITNDDGSKTLKVYSTYSEAQKRATKKYRENNKDKVNEQRKKYYQNRKTKDPNFLIYKRQKAKEYYAKKKDRIKEAIEKTELHKLIEEVKEPVKEVIIEKVEIHEYPVLDETKEEKKKRKYTKKVKTV
jgi:hypothetical protein